MTIGGKVGGGVLIEKDHDEDGKCWGHNWIPKKVEDSNTQYSGDSRPDWLQS